MSQDRILALLRQVNAGTAITAEEEALLGRDGLIDVIETFPVTIELTLRGKRMLAAGASPYSEAAQRRADVIAAENGETVGERNVIREAVLPLCAEIERLRSALDAADAKLRRYEGGSCAGMLDRS